MIKIIDAYMGYGKSTGIINEIKNNPDKKYIVIVPYLTELERYKNKCGKNFHEPNTKNEDGSKIISLKFLLKNKKNIVSTHACFKSLNKEDLELLKGYTLILDEVLDVINVFDLNKGMLEGMLKTNWLTINKETKLITWQPKIEEELPREYEELRTACGNQNAYLINEKVIIWEYPVEIFKEFNEVKILTYQFKGSIMDIYFKKNNIEYQLEKVDDTKFKKMAKLLINIYKGSMNKDYEKAGSLNKTSYKKLTKEEKEKLATRAKNFFCRNAKTKFKFNAWTSYKNEQNKLKVLSSEKSFIPCNCKGTNEFCEIQSMAYLINLFIPNEIKNYFVKDNYKVSDDEWALNMMIQWIWRSRIRKEESINLYIPSKRMRDLLIKWLG